MQMLEHIHVNVRSLKVTEQFLRVAVPELQVRGGGHAEAFGHWIHFGDEERYLAFTESASAESMSSLRHIGLVVDDLDALIDRLSTAGIEPSDDSALTGHPYRRRVYYRDGNSMDWEFVEYLSEDPKKRNDYSR